MFGLGRGWPTRLTFLPHVSRHVAVQGLQFQVPLGCKPVIDNGEEVTQPRSDYGGCVHYLGKYDNRVTPEQHSVSSKGT